MVTEGEPAHQSDSNASFLRAARSGNLEKILEYLKGSIDINTSNANGLNALHLAAKEGHVAIVQELVKKGANVNAATKKGNTALHIASLAGQEEVAKILIKGGANPNVQSQNGFTPLYMAAQENHDNVVKLLLANGANQSLATEDGFTPLAVALQQGHDKVVAVLLENDAKGRVRLPALHIAAKKDDCKAAALLLQNDHDPDVTSKSGFTPLHIAAHYGNENIAALLLDKNADVNYSAKHQITPLHVAAKWGRSNMVTLLIDKGAKIDASTRDGLTPLHCAARSGHDQVVDLLLEKGAPITAKTKNGLAPLHMASQGDHVDSARILLYHKAPVDDVTVDYLTALHVAAHCGHVRVAKLLLDRKADPNARALNGFTPLHIACKKNRIKVVELLLKHGASIEATTESGLTPLHVASFMGCMNIVIYLIQHGANPDVPTVRGETPLHLAARANQSDIIRILLRNGAHVDASAREQQTPLHIAARLGNVDIVGLLLQHGAAVDATTKDMYTALHIAAKEGQEEVASVLLDHGASLTATTKKGFTPLHLAAKYGNIKVARLLLQKDAPVDAQGKNGVTPLHVAAHYDHVNVALLLLDKGAFPHATAKNGYTPLHIAAKKNQMDIATTLLEYGAKPSAESKAGFTPLHLAAQEGHTDMTTLLIEHHADVNAPAKNGLTPLHLCAQEDKVNVAAILVKNGAKVDPPTKAGYTPLHVACHFGQINMIRFLLQHGADVNATTSHGYTPLHQAAQQGHTLIINLLLEHKASPNTTTNQGQTALSIAQRLGYISVVETLKIVTETIVTTTTTTITEEKYKVVAPETMQETFMSDSEDEGAEDQMMGDQSLHYMTTDELKALQDDNTLGIDVTRDEREHGSSTLIAPLTAEEDHLTPQHVAHQEATFSSSMAPDNVDLARAPVHAGFLVSFMVDARGGAMRGCRHSGVRVIIPPRRAPMPMRITCRYLRKEKLAYPPPLMEGEACASRILEVGPSGAKFLGPVIIEVPHFASLRGREREITILRSDNGETWREHSLEASDDAVHDVFNESFEGEELTAIEDLSTNRITRILTTDFPQYFAIITRIRQEVHAIGPEGGMVSSTVIPQVQAIFPEGALTKKIKVGLQAQPITPELVTKLLGNRVAVSPIVTVEPRRRKFHKPITLTIPVPQAATKGMINQYSGDAPTLRLLCSITGSTKTGGTTKAQWEDVTGSTPLTFVNDCVSFTTTVSARFWLMDCRQVNEATKFATELYREAIHVPFMAKFVVFAKRRDPLEAQLRVFCMTDDKEDKTLESQEHFTEVAKSRDVEVLEAKLQYLEFAGNLVPVTKSGEQLSFTFQAFRENRLPFTIRVKDTHQEPMGRVAFMREPRVSRGEPPQTPICNLNIVLPEPDLTPVSELVTLEKKYGFVQETSLAKPELIHRADLRLSDIAKELRNDWIPLALQLDLPESDINSIRSENPNDTTQQALVMLRHWLHKSGSKATGNLLEKGLRKINREDIVNQCMFNVELVTDDVEKAVAKVHLDQSGFDTFKEELGSSRDASLRRDASLNGTFDEQDIMKEAESAAETSSESSDKEAHFRSETRHSDKASKRTAEAVSQSVNKSFEEGPETLVQNIPSALSETYPQNLSNGQVSDASVHEDDKSELTAATLSSEATAEMEVSSLEDKSQTETHVEKKEFSKTGFQRQGSGFRSVHYNGRRRTINDMKSMRENKRNSTLETNRRKVSFSVNPWTMTTPAFGRKKRMITRRNSWPPDSPRKLNPRRKYQQRFRNRDFPEPFWTDTYEWLIMQNSPEHMKSAPLAKLTEFVEQVTIKNITPKADYSYSSYLKSTSNRDETRKNRQSTKYPDVIGFYFVKSNKVSNDPKKYLMKLKKRCLDERTNSNIHAVDSSNFINPVIFENTSNSLPYEKSKVSKTKQEISCSVPYAIANIDEYISSDNHFHSDEENFRIFESSEEIYVQSNVPPRSHRPLQSINLESFGDIMMETALPDFDSVVFVKHKAPPSVVPWNKENINKTGFPNAKFPDHGEYSKIPILSSVKKGSKTSNLRKPLNTKLISENNISKLPKDIDSKTPDFNTAPQDMPDPVPSKSDKTGSSKKEVPESSPSQGTGSTSGSTVHITDTGPESSASSETVTSGQGHSNRSYARQLFEHDIHAKKGKTSNKEEEAPESQEEKSKKQSVSSSSKPEAKSPGEPTSTSSENVIPADVVGFSFLKSLKERVELDDTAKETTFPASAIGYAFLSNLIEQQSRVQETQPSEKSVPASVIGLSFLKSLVEEEKSTKEQPIPASVIGQTFLKNLVDSQSQPEPEAIKKESANSQFPNQPPAKCEKEPLIPSSVLGQAFLKTLVETSQSISKPEVIPSEVVGQTFLKSLIEEVKPQNPPTSSNVIPANILGQSFLKNLIEQSPAVQSSESPTVSDQDSAKGVIPATVLGQSFLKSLVQEGSTCDVEVKDDTIPATVVGQTFLKTLLESPVVGSMKSDTTEAEKPIPSSVIGQTFMKSLIESSLKEVPKVQSPDLPTDPSVIPATVVGQAFLKTLIGDSSKEGQSETSQPIPAPVIGQSFLKSLIEEQVKSQEVLTEKPIPANVVGQAFLKTLIDQDKSAESEPSISKPIPSSVVGQAFLKTLVEQEKKVESEASISKAIPSSVVGQAFLKTLIGQEKIMEIEASTSQPIPSTVVGQAFLKTLIDQGGSKETEPKPIPSTVVGQTFLKSLLETGQPSASPPESKLSAAIPSTVVGQAFLKTLIQQEIPSKADEGSSKAIPSSVVGQTFLKTLLSEPQEDGNSVEKSIPATVVGQAFLKTLLDQGAGTGQKAPQTTVKSPSGESVVIKEVEKENIIPSTVLGQAFLKTILQETVATVPSPESSPMASVEAIPASVVGSFFLKSLVDQTKDIEVLSQSEKEKPLPASVIGQAFLKTLCMDVESMSTPACTSSDQGASGNVTTASKCQEKDSLNGHSHDHDLFENGHSSEIASSSTSVQLMDLASLSEIEDQNPIIPPPPEFSSTDSPQNIISEIPETSTDIDVASGIIGELLNYTKMMHSVIESMQDSSQSQAPATKKEPGS